MKGTTATRTACAPAGTSIRSNVSLVPAQRSPRTWPGSKPDSSTSSRSPCSVRMKPWRFAGLNQISVPFIETSSAEDWRGSFRPRALRVLREHDALRLGALRPIGCVVLHLRAFGERLVALTRDGAVVDEDVLAAFVRGDEAIPLRV